MKLYDGGAYLVHGTQIIADNQEAQAILKSKLGEDVPTKEEAAK